MTKRIVSIILCLMLFLGLVACGNEQSADNSDKNSSVSTSSSNSKAPSKDDTSKPVSNTETASKEPEKPLVNIMPLGDSLTKGGNYKTGDNPDLVKSSSSYRSYLSKMLKDGGYNTKFVGSHDWAKDLIVDGNVMHSGYGGATVFSLRDRLVESKDANPDIILLMIGRNDMSDGTRPDDYVSFLDKHLIAEIYKMFPDVHIFLASIPVVRNHDKEELLMNADTDYAPKIEEYVKQKKSAGAKIDFVDMRVSATGLAIEDFTAEDFVHPQPAGYEKIAKQWYASITGKITEIAEAKAAA